MEKVQCDICAEEMNPEDAYDFIEDEEGYKGPYWCSEQCLEKAKELKGCGEKD